MNRALLSQFTNFGDTAVILPLALLLTLLLWKYESFQAAWVFMRAVAACLVMIAALKFMLLSCGHITKLPASSPSGHAALTLFFYGSLATVAFVRQGRSAKVAIVVFAFALISVVAVSRVTLDAHTPLEVVTGLFVGLLALGWFIQSYSVLTHRRLPMSAVAFILGPVLLLTLGKQLPVERNLRGLVPNFQISVCPV